jgi:hypothetical protein
MPGPFEAFYRSELQGLWALLVVPAVFVAVRPWLRERAAGADPRAAGFVRAWATVFALETMIDPLAVVLAGVPMLPFVLLGDFRVFALWLGVMAPGRPLGRTLLAAACWTLVVPLVAWSLHRLLESGFGPLPEQVLWLVYEVAFTGMALWWATRVVPRRRPVAARFLRATAWYVAAYYALWALSDVLILAGLDAGWALRVAPNQLYYAFWVPVVWWWFFSPRYAATSTSVQTRR